MCPYMYKPFQYESHVNVPEPSKMERIIKDFRIANNLSPMESTQQLNRPGGRWWDFDLLPLGGNLSLVLLIEIVPR